jgi:hypothetical protein
MSGQQQFCINDSDCPAGLVCTISTAGGPPGGGGGQTYVCAMRSSATDAGGG